MVKKNDIQYRVSDWVNSLDQYRSQLHSGEKPWLGKTLRVWLGGPSQMSTRFKNYVPFFKALTEFLRQGGLEVYQSEFLDNAQTDACSCEFVVILAVSPGSCAEAAVLSQIDSIKQKLMVFIPDDFRHGYVHQELKRRGVPRIYSTFPLRSLNSPECELPLTIIRRLEREQSFAAQNKRLTARDERTKTTATIIYIEIHGLRNLQDTKLITRALSNLSVIICDARDRFPSPISVHSSLGGAILAVPDSSNISTPDIINFMAEESDKAGLPLRFGIAHGDLDPVIDVDKSENWVSPAINMAARVAMSSENHGALLENSYFRHATIDLANWNGFDKNGEIIEVKGKRDEIFQCKRGPNLPETIFDENKLAAPPKNTVFSCGLIAFDLPNFSDGDRQALRRRFRELSIEVWQATANLSQKFFYSPGGDGGILVIPETQKEEVYVLAKSFFNGLIQRSADLAQKTEVKCRVGVHYGQVEMYTLNEITRPSGWHLIIADRLANDMEARNYEGVIISDQIGESIKYESKDKFKSDFQEINPLQTPLGNVRRFVEHPKNVNIAQQPETPI